jgi:ATP-dependent Clp protease adapter protein ClpS
MKVFHMPAPRATQVMLDVQKTGEAFVNKKYYDAITKVDEVP